MVGRNAVITYTYAQVPNGLTRQRYYFIIMIIYYYTLTLLL